MLDTSLGHGPSPMALGSFAFRALGFSFHGQGRELETPWAELEVAADFDHLQWTGPKSDSFSIRGVIFEESFGGEASLNGIRQAAISGRPLMLVTRAGRVHGNHVIFGVSEDRSLIRADGMSRRNEYEIKLRKYAGPGGIGGLALTAIGRLF